MSVNLIEPFHPDIGTGIYTIKEASHILHVNAGSLRRWVDGYRYTAECGDRKSTPVLERSGAEQGLLTFYEVIEMRFVREFLNCGVKLQDIRDAAQRLREEWQTPYPFVQNRLQTDGAQLLLAYGEQYRNVANCQQVFEFAKMFFKDIDLNENGMADKWWPMGRESLVVIDPKRAFGAPIDIRSGIRTDILYRAYLAEQDIEAVVDWYEVSAEAVKDAIEFEEQWLKAA